MLGKIQNIRFDNFLLNLSDLPTIAFFCKVFDGFRHTVDEIIAAKQVN